MMTSQPAVQGCVLLLMTVYTKGHLKVYLHQSVIPFHLAVARSTVNPHPDVWLMVEFYIIGDIENPHPRHRGLRVEMPSFLHDLRMPGNDIRVAEKAERHGRDSCILRSVHIRMAEPATDLFHPRMNAMAEIDGLLWTEPFLRVDEVKVEHRPKQDCDNKQRKNPVASGRPLFHHTQTQGDATPRYSFRLCPLPSSAHPRVSLSLPETEDLIQGGKEPSSETTSPSVLQHPETLP
jgi:hypothetical protein